MNRCLTLIDRVRSYSVDDSVTRILPNIVTLTAINIFQESLGYYSVCDVVFAAKILSQKTHRWHVSAYKHKVKSAGAAWNMLLLQQILQTGLWLSQHGLSFAGSGHDSRPGEMYISWNSGPPFILFLGRLHVAWLLWSTKHTPEMLCHLLCLQWGHCGNTIAFSLWQKLWIAWVACLWLVHSDIYSSAEEQNISQFAIFSLMKSCACHSCVFCLFS